MFDDHGVQFWIGILCIVFAVLSGTWGSWEYHIKPYTKYSQDMFEYLDEPVINTTKMDAEYMNIIQSTWYHSYTTGLYMLRGPAYNFILSNIIIFLFGLNFIFRDLEKT